MNRDIADMRMHYTKGVLTEASIFKNPIDQFKSWFEETAKCDVVEPNAMIIATVDKNGVPSARTVLLKEIDSEGFLFYTNYASAKAKDISINPNVSLVFLWKEIERQVRITGVAEKITTSRSEDYFHKRPKDSQIGAWVSPQSSVIENREVLEKRLKKIESKFKHEETVPLPDFWGGYLVKPTAIEFWQGRPSRLHDRLRYKLHDGNWKVERLAP
jgi:pyridoxamine 5'-phosphate oxidase